MEEFSDMLKRLKALHQTLTELISTMRGLISHNALPEQVGQTRLKLSQASRSRTRYMAETIYPVLLAHLPDAKAKEVRSLQRDGEADRVNSSNHVGKWSSASLASDWAGFRRDSAVILTMMAKRIDREKAVLYPLLQRTA